jgi:large subunit ribosomal protein L30
MRRNLILRKSPKRRSDLTGVDMAIAVVRVRGSVNVPRETRRILHQLGLERPNNVVLLDESETYAGMLQKVRHLVTYGSPSEKAIEFLIRKRGEVKGHGRLTDQYVAENTGFSSIAGLAKSLSQNKASVKDVPMMKRTFRCSPPSKGYENVKRSFQVGGSVGDRGEAIDELLKRMA